MVELRGSRWTTQEDALLRGMAEANIRPDIIAVKLNRTIHAVKARAYLIGLPLKWFKLKAKKAKGNERDATSALDPGAGQKTPSARTECEQRRRYCRGSKPNHFCGTSQGKHTEASIEKDCVASQTDLIHRLVE